MKKIIITGAAGFIGTNCTIEAINRGYTVYGFDNLHRPLTEENLTYLQEYYKDKFVFIHGDIRNESDYIKLPTDAAGIIHLAGQCFDGQTEFLSEDGWHKISEYNGQKIAQYDESGSVDFVKPLRYIKIDSKELWEFSSPNGLDQCLSKDHLFVYEDYKSRLKKIRFEDLIKKHNKLKDGFNGKVITSFSSNANSPLPLSDNELRLQVAVIADGWFTNDKDNRVEISLKRKRKIERLTYLLKASNLKYNCTTDKRGRTRFNFYAPMRIKEFTKEFYLCPQSQLKIICNEVLKWDGDQKKQFSTNSKISADFIQFAFSAIGFRATINKDIRKKRNTNYRVCITNKTRLSLGGRHDKKLKIKRIKPKDGKQYCFTVPTSMLVMRRNDKIFISSNCGIPYAQLSPRYDFEVNGLGTLNVLEFSRLNGKIPVAFASSNKAYTNITNSFRTTETKTRYEWSPKIEQTGVTIDGINEYLPLDAFGKYARSLYGASKVAGDLYMQEYYQAFGVPTVVNRMSCIYGLFQKGVEDQAWVDWFIRQILLGDGKINIFGTGKQVRDMLWGEDVARLYLDEIENIDKVKGKPYNIGGGATNTMSLLEAIAEIEEQTGKYADLAFLPKRHGDQDVWISDIGKIRSDLGWEPKVKPKDGIANIISQYKKA